MKIGLLMPARERLNLNLTLISSIITTVDDINNIALYMGIDDDDPTRDIQLKIAAAIPFVKIVPIHNEGKFIGLGRMWNILARQCNDEIFGYIGNDMIFRTPGWDTRIINEFMEQNCPEDKIKLVHCDDGHHGAKLSVNAFVHRKYYDLVGYFCREEFLINWSDQWMYQSFKAFNRVTYIPDILIEHNHWVFNKRSIDNTGKRMMSVDQGGISDKLWHTLAPERINEIKKIGNYINMAPNWSFVDTDGFPT